MSRIVLLAFLATTLSSGQQLPQQDRRNVEIRHTDFVFSGPDYDRLRPWRERAERLRKQILFSAGLLPAPRKNPLNPQIYDRIEHDDYTVEKVLLETWPGFYLGANLYRPKGKQGPFPAVLSPHGHWTYGRLEHQELASVPARGVNFAKQGYVAVTYDMVGYADTRQLPHGPLGGKRVEMWGVGLLGVQLWDSIRVVDFLQSLSDVDPERIAVTGASGGGTQSFLLQAVDERIKWSAPVNMVSYIMQGGSECENAPGLRIDTHNVELAALMAPRPMLLVSATGDWTRNVPRDEYQAIKKIYELYDAGAQLEVVQFDSPHNYHQGSREAVYRFFGKRILDDGDETHFVDQRFPLEQLSDMLSLWGRELPADAVDQERFVAQRIAEAGAAIEELRPRDAASLEQARGVFRERLELALKARQPTPNELASDLLDTLPNGEQLVIGRRDAGDRIPAVILNPPRLRRPPPAARPTLIVHPEGSAWALSSAESRDGFVAALHARNGTVMAIDAFQTGHAVAARDIVGAGRRAETYFTTFNRTDTANRVQDILTAITYARTRLNSPDLNLVCFGEAGSWCGLARALADGEIHMAIDWNGFDASDDAAYVKRLFTPGLLRAGGLMSAAALWTDGSLFAWNAGEGFPSAWVEASFAAAAASQQVRRGAADFGEILEHLPGR